MFLGLLFCFRPWPSRASKQQNQNDPTGTAQPSQQNRIHFTFASTSTADTTGEDAEEDKKRCKNLFYEYACGHFAFVIPSHYGKCRGRQCQPSRFKKRMLPLRCADCGGTGGWRG
ncbi:857104ca-9a19-4754-8416-97c4ee44dad4 [Thermothielavioides terrestris]|nr:857104ca-9a19-4754-8416-97c4ee44dad4 [Thermothielavioides terrestris]